MICTKPAAKYTQLKSVVQQDSPFPCPENPGSLLLSVHEVRLSPPRKLRPHAPSRACVCHFRKCVSVSWLPRMFMVPRFDCAGSNQGNQMQCHCQLMITGLSTAEAISVLHSTRFSTLLQAGGTPSRLRTLPFFQVLSYLQLVDTLGGIAHIRKFHRPHQCMITT